jgi:hypothetical protein
MDGNAVHAERLQFIERRFHFRHLPFDAPRLAGNGHAFVKGGRSGFGRDGASRDEQQEKENRNSRHESPI